MNRRQLLQGAGIRLTGGSSLDREAEASSQNERRVLITSGETELAQVIADHLSRDRGVRLTGLTAVPSRFPFTASRPDYPVNPVHRCSIILFPKGHELLLFHSRMIRNTGRGRNLPETNASEPQRPKKEIHEDTRRTTKGHEENRQEVHPYSCSFVSICGSSSNSIDSFFLE